MKFVLNEYHRNVSDYDLIVDLKRVAKELQKETISRNEYDAHGKYSEGTLRKRFSGWLNALKEAGLKAKYHYLTNDEILNELKRISKLLGKEFLTQEDVRKCCGTINEVTVARRFGSWVGALQKAGLKVSKNYHRRYSNEEYFENLLNVWTHYGRQPIESEMKRAPSLIGPDGYTHRFGGWRKALEAFVARMDQDDSSRKQSAQERKAVTQAMVPRRQERQNAAVEDKRGINLGLRYKVLSRDKFKCVKCGMSPATDHKCRLHVDHKVPFSKGGKTILENLQTLCENCNLGKGDRHLE